MFDVYYIGDNPGLCEHIPFAQRVESESDVAPNTKMYWIIEPNVELLDYDVLEFRPPVHDQTYTHIWKWNPGNYGGIKLRPVEQSAGVKQVNRVVCRKKFDILNTKNPGKYFDKHPYATHVWCVDPEYKLSADIDWAPDNFEPDFVHSFHLFGQLEHKYPDNEGGIKLYPRAWKKAKTKYHGFLDAGVKYPVIRVQDVEDYAQRDTFADEYVWLIDHEHLINPDTLDWVPDPFERDFVHCFRMPYQLTEKYPQTMGGIRLVPRHWKDAAVKIHPDCPVQDAEYDVFYTNKPFDSSTFEFYAKRTETDWFWVIDRDYDFNGKLLYVPAEHEQEYIHVFKWGLDFRYPPEVLDLWDNRVAGIYLVHTDFDITKQKLHTDVVPVRYDIFFTNDINDLASCARKSRTDAFWMVDTEHTISEVFKWVPPSSEQKYINIFKLPGQLQHKYPTSVTNVSDNRCGGVKLVPKDYNSADVKYQGSLTAVDRVQFEEFEDEETGRMNTKHDWFWVIDSNINILENFDFAYVPDVWDSGKTHMWQKLNPITGRQYDYGGIMLCPREPQEKGRPKYIREPACAHKEYPVYTLDGKQPILEQLEGLDAKTGVDMYWAVDPYVQVDPEFKFDYYPTQWDTENVHVFSTSTGRHSGVRLYPTHTFASGHNYTALEINNNSFDKLKLMDTVACTAVEWPIEQFTEYSRDIFLTMLGKWRAKGMDFFWTVDPDVEAVDNVVKSGFVPEIINADKVHVWQRVNPHTSMVQGYGGVRLWPTARDYSDVTTDSLRLNKLKRLHYVREPGSTYKYFEVVFISYHEPVAQAAYDKLSERVTAHWVRDVEGIFDAHQHAAKQVSSTMFWVVDADAELADDFDFSYIPDVYDQEVTHVWAAKNPITGHEYGYGGVKLFNTQQVIDATSWGLDFTTGLSSRFKAMPEISCTTRFNTDAFSTWRSAFRECVKLALKEDTESQVRLQSWLFPLPGVEYRAEAKAGAAAGKTHALENANKPMRLAKINDYEWLEEQYHEHQSKVQ